MKLNLNLVCVGALLVASAGGMRASVIYSLSIDLSSLNSGTDFSGSVTLGSALGSGGSTPITLIANVPADYTPSTLNATLTIGPGPSGFNSVFFSALVFTDNTSGHAQDILVLAAAHCGVDPTTNPLGVPCSTAGEWMGNNQFGGTGSYSVTVSQSSVPEPRTAIVLVGLALLAAFKTRLLRIGSGS